MRGAAPVEEVPDRGSSVAGAVRLVPPTHHPARRVATVIQLHAGVAPQIRHLARQARFGEWNRVGGLRALLPLLRQAVHEEVDRQLDHGPDEETEELAGAIAEASVLLEDPPYQEQP